MSNKNEVLDALSKLDPARDDDWTEDGMPSLDRVKELMLDDEVTREQVTEASAGLTREVAAELKAKVEGGPLMENSEGEKGDGAETDAVVDLNLKALDAQERRIELENVVADVDDEISIHDQGTRERARERDALVAKRDEAKRALQAEFPPLNQAEMTQQWLRVQHARREAAAQAVMVHRNPASALDASMRRATGFGGGRKKVPNLFAS